MPAKNRTLLFMTDLPNLLGPPRCSSVPVLALEAQLPTGLTSRPTHRDTCPHQVLIGTGVKGLLPVGWPVQPVYQIKTGRERVKGTGVMMLVGSGFVSAAGAGVRP